MTDQDLTAQLLENVMEACEHGRSFYIRGGNSKKHILGRDCDAPELDVSQHRGIVDYQPGELVITARAGTPLTELVDALSCEGQILPFEPPLFSGQATLGGTLACNLSGPARPWWGSIRDAVLGVQLINGRGELLNFGGRVMKNVAGYDMSRLQAGALGTLGLITQVTLRLLPAPEASTTLSYAVDRQEALAIMNRRGGEPRPLSGAAWSNERLYLRLSGAASAVHHTSSLWGGEQPGDAQNIWNALREWQLSFFATPGPLWRLSVPGTAPLPADAGEFVLDWGGAQRWLRSEASATEIHRMVSKAGGHATLFRGGDRSGEVRATASPAAKRLHQRLKQALDPQGLFNPGRLYDWL
jgi:glycolate oxidase FAD binding subunit